MYNMHDVNTQVKYNSQDRRIFQFVLCLGDEEVFSSDAVHRQRDIRAKQFYLSFNSDTTVSAPVGEVSCLFYVSHVFVH